MCYLYIILFLVLQACRDKLKLAFCSYPYSQEIRQLLWTKKCIKVYRQSILKAEHIKSVANIFVDEFLCWIDCPYVCSWHVWISPQLSQQSWSGQLASVWQAEAGIPGAGPVADGETETEEGQGPFCYCHPPSEAGTVSSSSQTWELISGSCHIVCMGPKFESVYASSPKLTGIMLIISKTPLLNLIYWASFPNLLIPCLFGMHFVTEL